MNTSYVQIRNELASEQLIKVQFQVAMSGRYNSVYKTRGLSVICCLRANLFFKFPKSFVVVAFQSKKGLRKNLSSMTSPVVKAKITTGDINKLSLVLGTFTASFANCKLTSMRSLFMRRFLFGFKICRLIFLPYAISSKRSKFNFPPLVCVGRPVNAIAALFEVIKPRKQRNCQLETNLFLESHIQLVRLACSSILSIEAGVFLNKNASKWEEREHC